MKLNWRWLLNETMTVLLVGYAISIAGTINGLVTVRLEVATLLLIICGGGWWVIRVWKLPQAIPDLGLPLLGFGVALILTTLFSVDPRRSLIHLSYWAVVTLAYWAAADSASSPEGYRHLTRALLATTAALTLVALYQAWLWWGGVGFRLDAVPPRFPSVMGNPNTLATLLLVAGVLLMQRIVLSGSRWSRAVSTLWLFVTGFILVLTGSRAAWAGAAAGAVTFVALALLRPGILSPREWWGAFRQRHLLVQVTTVMGLGLGVVLGGSLIPLLFAQAGHPTHAPFNRRVGIWRAAWRTFALRPLVGSGPFTIGSRLMEQISTPPEAIHAHAHNLLLHIMAEMGLVGLLMLGLLLAKVVTVLHRAYSGDDDARRWQAILAATLVVTLLANSLFDMTFLPSISLAALWVFHVLLPPLRVAAVPGWQAAVRRLAAPFLLVVGVGLWGWQIPAEMAATDGAVASAEGDWVAAARDFERAARRDPGLVVYEFQAAYAYGQAGVAGDGRALQLAIERYRAALAQEPAYALHWANLAILEYARGDGALALEHARLAASLAPLSAIAELPGALQQGESDGHLYDPDTFPSAVGADYGWYLFHVPGPDMRLLPMAPPP